MAPPATSKKTTKQASAPASQTLDQLERRFLKEVDHPTGAPASKPTAVPSPKDAASGDVVIGTFKRWSASAVECYLREANCNGCYYKHFFSDKPYDCKMHLAVNQLMETHGPPGKNLINRCS